MTTATQIASPVHAPATIGELLRDPTLAFRVQSVSVPGYDAHRLLREVAADLRAHPGMKACTPTSMLIAIVGIASVGLSLAPLAGEVFLVPRRNKSNGTTDATVMVGRNGWVSLAMRTGRVANIYAHAVYENDKHFSIKLGTGYNVEHEPALENRGEIIAAYGVAELKSGARRIVLMDKNDIAAVRAMADEKSEAWRKFAPMMCEKTAVKRVARLVAGGHALMVRADVAERGATLEVPTIELEAAGLPLVDEHAATEAPAQAIDHDENPVQEDNAAANEAAA